MNSRMTRPPISPPDAARSRFVMLQTLLLIGFGVLTVAANRLLPHTDAPLLRALLVGAPIALLLIWAWKFFRMIRADDEMMQVVQLRAVALAAGSILLAAGLWDIVVRLLGAPSFPAYLLLPAFAVLYACILMVLTRRL